MNVRTKRIIAVFELVIVIALIVWALCPRSIGQALGGSFDQEQVTQVQAVLTKDGVSRDIFFSPDDPAYEALMTLLSSQKYVPIYLDKDTRYVTLEYDVILAFRQEGADHTMHFSGDDPIWFTGSDVRDRSFRTSGGEAFQQEILDFLLAQSGDSPS